MFDLTPANRSTPTRVAAAFAADAAHRYAGPERRTARAAVTPWLAATLDEIDYGVLLLSDTGRAIHINHAACDELDGSHPLHLVGRELHARRPQDVGPLHAALQAAAQRGLRKLLTLGDGAQRVSASVVPITRAGADGVAATLLLLGKRRVCGELAAQGFARAHGLTGAETRVLTALCNGIPPGEVAEQLGVAISTVRTQIGNIRVKTGAQSIRDLVRQVAVLPPMMGVLRSGPPILDGAAWSAT